MQSSPLPFNITIFDPNDGRLKKLRPVLTTDISEGATNNFHEDGLFSVPIFGRMGSDMRDTQFSYIDIKIAIFHPMIYKALTKLKRLYGGILEGRTYAVWDSDAKDFVESDAVNGETGYLFFINHWKEIRFRTSKSTTRSQTIEMIEKYRNVAMTDKVLVIPAGLRDIRVTSGNRLEEDEINGFYRRLVGISRTITNSNDRHQSVVLNTARMSLQRTFNEIYELILQMLSGKKGFIQGKWGRRRVANGTRNVITSMNPASRYLGDTRQGRASDTIVGLYQMAKAIQPKTIHYLFNGWISQVFPLQSSSNSVRLIDPKTLSSEYVDLPSQLKDEWTTTEGITRFISRFAQPDIRYKPVMVGSHYLGLIYKGQMGGKKVFKIFGDIKELPEHLDKKDVHPLSIVELLYLSGYRHWDEFIGFVTRYPVTGPDSTYPSTLHTKTSVVGEFRYELDDHWEIIGDTHMAPEFPTRDPEAFVDSLVISTVRLAGLGADFNIGIPT